MSRSLRLVLDFALGSVTKARPVISNAWDSTKDYVVKTRAKRLVCNNLVYKLEEKVNEFTELLITKMTALRNDQLPKEAQYLQRELDNIKQRLQKEGLIRNLCTEEHVSKKKSACASKTFKEKGALSWRYLKVEAVPPFTVGLFNGPIGDKLDASVEKVMDSIINAIAGQIKAIDEEEARLIREKEAAIKAEQERQIAEAKKKAEEKKAAEIAAKKAAAAKAVADAAAETAKSAKSAPATGAPKTGSTSGTTKSASKAGKQKKIEKKVPKTKPKSK